MDTGSLLLTQVTSWSWMKNQTCSTCSYIPFSYRIFNTQYTLSNIHISYYYEASQVQDLQSYCVLRSFFFTLSSPVIFFILGFPQVWGSDK